MKKIIILLICLFLGLNASAKQIRFAQVTDIYYSSNNPNIAQILNWAVSSLNLKEPQFVIFLGNSIGKSNHKNTTEFLQTIRALKMPYYIVFGNYDVHEMGGLKKEDFWTLVRKYNKNNKSINGYYTFAPNKDILCIVLDGTVPYMQNNHGIYPDEQLKWLDKTLSKNKNKKIMIFQHFPIIDPYENRDISLLNKKEYQDIIDKHDNIVSISSGHFQTGKTTIDKKGIYHISSPALSKPNFNYDIITVDYSKSLFSKIKINEIKVTPINLQ